MTRQVIPTAEEKRDTMFSCRNIITALFAIAMMPGSQAMAAPCTNFIISSKLLNVREDAGRPHKIIDVIEKDDVVCITGFKTVSGGKWGYILHRYEGEKNIRVNGWSFTDHMARLSPKQFHSWLSTVRFVPTNSSPVSRQKTAQLPVTPKPSAQSPSLGKGGTANKTAGSRDGLLKFTDPIPHGVWPIQGRSLKQLANGIPLFTPIEGLPKEIWTKKCTNCHRWNRDRLCNQAKNYTKDVGKIFRIKHPYGGTYKNSLMAWARSGCP